MRGVDIPIEERHEDEVTGAWGVDPRGRRLRVRVANATSHARNPGFDVTPPDLITGLITPVGTFKPRDLWKNRRALVGEP
jgi:methylthioribose-1-phosphate isomerase